MEENRYEVDEKSVKICLKQGEICENISDSNLFGELQKMIYQHDRVVSLSPLSLCVCVCFVFSTFIYFHFFC